jgi:AI-2 transport protein TqsA
MATRSAESGSRYRTISLIILAVLGTIAALYFMKAILIPVTLAVVLACMLSPATTFLRRVLPLSPTGAAAVLFLLTVLFGLYLTSLTAESLVQATINLPLDIASLSLRASDRIRDLVRDKPSLKFILPEPGTINELGESNRRLLSQILTFGLADLSGWVAQGLIVLILVLFLLAESEMLTPKVVRFFARTPGEAAAAERTLKDLTRQIRSFLMTRTLINLGLGLIFAFFLWRYNVRSPFLLGLFAGLTNFVPYLGQLLGGGLPFLVTLAQYESLGDALIVASVFLGLVTIEGYVITPYILGRSLDLNGTVILIACLFWGFLWGLVGLILAMPITACIKLVCQNIPELHRWADLMSRDWQPPPAVKDDLELTP